MAGIRYPIIQAPMNWVSGAQLVAAVSNAGALGVLGPNAGADRIDPDVEGTAERMRGQIKKIRAMTGNAFAVNVPIGIGDAMKFSKRCIEVVIEEKVPIVITSVGGPTVYTERLKKAGIIVFHAVSVVKHALKAEEVGVDAVICEGFEAGGHKGFTELTTLVLTPMVADAVKIPVIAGGGIADARGVIAALALGADAVYMGTRFMITKESSSHTNVKQSVIRAEDVCTVSVPKDYMLARDLVNAFTRQYLDMKNTGATPEELREYIADHSMYKSQFGGDAENAEIGCGQAAGLISDLPPAADIITGIVERISDVLEEVKGKLANFQI